MTVQKRLIDDTEDSSIMKHDGIGGQSDDSEQRDAVNKRQTSFDISDVEHDAHKHHLRQQINNDDDEVDDEEAARRCAAGVRSACRRRLRRRDVAKQQQQQLDQLHKVHCCCHSFLLLSSL